MEFVLTVAPQDGLKILGAGAAALVYEVNENIVLKACYTYQRPAPDASAQDWTNYSDSTLFSLHLSRQEKDILRLLEKHPCPNIAEAITMDEEEGIYLRRYTPLSQVKHAQPDRVCYYRDLLRGLNHLHALGICHSDLRPNNILLDRRQDRPSALLCDFSTASRFGEPNTISCAEEPVPRTGLAKVVSDATDRFAMACLIFELEIGVRPALAALRNGSIALPPVSVGHSGLDSIITKAWAGQYSSTSEMLVEVESLTEQCNNTCRNEGQDISKDELREQVKQWRQGRKDRYGERVPYFSSSWL